MNLNMLIYLLILDKSSDLNAFQFFNCKNRGDSLKDLLKEVSEEINYVSDIYSKVIHKFLRAICISYYAHILTRSYLYHSPKY